MTRTVPASRRALARRRRHDHVRIVEAERRGLAASCEAVSEQELQRTVEADVGQGGRAAGPGSISGGRKRRKR